MSLILQDRQVVLGYEGRQVLELSDHVYHQGERWVLTGPNGAGKSTFLRSLLESELILSGERKLSVHPIEIAWIPQAPRFSRQMPSTVHDFLVASLSLVQNASTALAPTVFLEIASVLERTGLSAKSFEPIASLSGGQVQRLLIARAFLLKARLYLLDEPFSAIQGDSKNELIALLDELQPQSLQIMALHDPSEIRGVGGHRICCHEGEVIMAVHDHHHGRGDDVVPLR